MLHSRKSGGRSTSLHPAGRFDSTAHPFDVDGPHCEVILQQRATIGCELVFGNADPAPFEVGRAFDAPVLAHIDRRVTEDAKENLLGRQLQRPHAVIIPDRDRRMQIAHASPSLLRLSRPAFALTEGHLFGHPPAI